MGPLLYLEVNMKITKDTIILENGDIIPFPKSGYIKFSAIESDGKEKVFLNGKEWVNGEWKTTLSAIWRFIF